MMPIKSVGIVLVVVLMGALAQLLMKTGVNSVTSQSTQEPISLLFLWRLLNNLAIWAALFLYASGLAAWMLVLSRLPLNFAYSFQALTYFLVPLGASWFLGESIPLLRWVGIAIICLGILIVGISQ
jgi:multidrug transporter EmrE-like cation transporter